LRACIAVVGWVYTTLCLVSYAAAFSHGASLSACADMMPRHLRVQLHSPSNNYISVHTNVSFYSPGDRVPVTVRSTRDFMGFLLQARKVSNDEIAGTFVFIPPGSKLLTCFEDGDTVTHSDKSLKRNLSFVWKAPDQPIGDIKFFISIVQSYFVYWAKIESAIVAQRGQNKTLAGSSKKPDPVTPVPSQGPADPHPTGMKSKGTGFLPTTSHRVVLQLIPGKRNRLLLLSPCLLFCLPAGQGPTSPVAATGSPLHPPIPPASPTGITATPAPEPGFGVGSDARLVAELKQLAWPSQPPFSSLTAHLVPFLLLKASTESGAVSKASRHATASPSVPHVHAHLGDTAATIAWFGDANAAGNLSSASRQTAERKLAPRPEEAGARGEEAAVGANTPPWVTRPAPKSAFPGKGEDPGRGTRLLAAQLGILLVCTTALGLALAAAVRCVCAQHCHKRTEVSFGEPDPDVLAVRENGEVMHFRKIRENSFVLVQAEYNWVSPSSNGKKTII
uniref:Reeler domain containing 1 n=1 Tax=Otus sunia TaxID=257818 RepID=A0A8C8BMV2_9STRI